MSGSNDTTGGAGSDDSTTGATGGDDSTTGGTNTNDSASTTDDSDGGTGDLIHRG